MNLYEKNLKFFEGQSKSIYDILTSAEKPRYDSRVSLINPLNLKVENEGKVCFINSLYDKKREHEQMFAGMDKSATKVVVFGMGMGGCISYLGREFKDLLNITVIEPDVNVFQETLKHIDIMDLLGSAENVTLLIGMSKDEATSILWSFFQNNAMTKVGWAYNISYRSLYADYYEHITKEMTRLINSFTVNFATNGILLYKWIENDVRNCTVEAASISRFAGRLDDIPVIIVGAGPSLNYNMHYLKEVKDKAIIIAAGSGIKVLDSNGIVPHFRIAFDPGDNERYIFQNINDEVSTLIFSDLLNYHIVEEYKGEKIRMTLGSDYFGQYLAEKIHENPLIFDSGFSITNVAMGVAVKLGVKKIIFMGQDLCYTEGSLYAKGSWREQDGMDFEQSKGYIKTTNCLGETVYTDRPFLAMRNIFEQKIQTMPEVAFINATERGINIDGATNKSFTDVMAEDLSESRGVEALISKIMLQNQDDWSNRWQEIGKLNLISQIEEISKLNDEILKRAKKLKKYKESGLGINKLQSELSYIKGLSAELDETELCREVVRPALQSNVAAIVTKHQYSGNDEIVLMEREIKVLLLITAEMKNYLEFFKNLCIEENL